MARQNYGFQKRQRELAKRQKKEEKLQRRLERKEAEARGEVLGSSELDSAGEPTVENAVEPEATPAESAS